LVHVILTAKNQWGILVSVLSTALILMRLFATQQLDIRLHPPPTTVLMVNCAILITRMQFVLMVFVMHPHNHLP
jgi:hypothetical protein